MVVLIGNIAKSMPGALKLSYADVDVYTVLSLAADRILTIEDGRIISDRKRGD